MITDVQAPTMQESLSWLLHLPVTWLHMPQRNITLHNACEVIRVNPHTVTLLASDVNGGTCRVNVTPQHIMLREVR